MKISFWNTALKEYTKPKVENGKVFFGGVGLSLPDAKAKIDCVITSAGADEVKKAILAATGKLPQRKVQGGRTYYECKHKNCVILFSED